MPSRRQLLATLPALLAGCASSPPARRTTTTTTPTPPETIESCRTTPDPPTTPTRDEAREFVATYEETRIYNWLVSQYGGPDECRPDGPGSSVHSQDTGAATSITVEPAQTAVITGTDTGHYVVSTCSGRAEYWCPDEGESCAGSGRNSHFVTHFVGDERHVRIPHNWFVCHVRDDPYRASEADANLSIPAADPGLTFRTYAFHEDATADVTLTYLDTGEQILEETYSPNVGPAVQANVTVATGSYKLVAETADTRTSHKFTVTGRDDSAWNGLCVYVGSDDLRIVEVATEGDLAVPESTCYGHRSNESETSDDSPQRSADGVFRTQAEYDRSG